MANRLSQIAYRKPKIIFIVGPTAIGKSEVAVCLAKKINGQIISCDSMQVYKGMGTLACWPGVLLRKRVPHYLIGIISPNDEYNVCHYNRDALSKVSEISRRGRTPVFVGGSGLYMSIVIDGIFKGAGPNQAIRRRLYRQLDKYGRQYLYRRLKKTDPEAAIKIHPHDSKRIIRALEVFQSLGKPISELKKQRKGLAEKYEIKIFGLNCKRDELYQRIDRRVERMFKRGIAGEVKKLLKLRLSKTARGAIGIKELGGYFNGEYNLERAKELIQRNSRHYAKRQLTWFRKDKRIEWININHKNRPQEVADKIWKRFC